MQITKKTFVSAGERFVRFVRAHGDMLLIVFLLLVVSGAGFFFYQLLYPPIYAPSTPRTPEAVFNMQLYEKVIERSNARAEMLQNQLDNLPANPFRP
jgi:hypothetical protein